MRIDQGKIDSISNKLKETYLEKFLSSFDIYGKENLKKVKGKQILFLSNHKSHFDYIAIPFALNEIGINHPAIIAGNNLDNFLLRGIISKETGAIFIDRRKISKIQEGKIERDSLARNLKSIIEEKNNLLIFPEGGRNGSNQIMNPYKTGILRKYFSLIKKEKVYLINIALDYSPQTIEKPFLKIVNLFKGKFYPAYFGADLLAFLSQPFRKKPEMKISFGKAINTNYFRDLNEIADYSKKNILDLYLKVK
jgi:1-acyl-sn-glycerol-3-phosphate acyltransferase